MEIRRLYPLLLLLAVAPQSPACNNHDKAKGSSGQDSGDSQTAEPRDEGCGGCGGGCGDDAPDDSADDSAHSGDDSQDSLPGDLDGDGYTVEQGDCDDDDASRNPGLAEVCDNIDNDCNGDSDDGLIVCFYPTSGEGSSMKAEFDAGTASSPAEIVLTTPGTLVLGAGEWFVNLRISADVSVTGAGVEVTKLSGGSLRSVVVVEDNTPTPDTVSIAKVSIVEGLGSELHSNNANFPAGGAVFCISDTTSRTQLFLDDVLVSETIAERGGVLYALGCDVTVSNATFAGVADNTLSRTGGAAYLVDATLSLQSVTATGFLVSQLGGAIYADKNSQVTLIDSVLSDNNAAKGGNIYTLGPVVCEGSSAIAGVRRGTADAIGGGVYIGDDIAAVITSTGCDWGSGDDDNSPDDVASDYFNGAQFSTESFTCDVNGCTLTE